MRGYLVRTFCWALSAMVLGACGQTEVAEVPEPGESSQAVLHPPPAPPSDNIVDGTAFLGPVSLNGSAQARFTPQNAEHARRQLVELDVDAHRLAVED
ncbi:hypothetical protein [Pyxidicoccus sp. MSG2]|uniref:hypothetical protein n=1 Tax=Pyxidicoccus sp. MSG2 TaxID=2996790 RepID=UPI002271AF8E|nr:hypothetical protein [Pyxidicoccus sp. MSG2]MCY1018111.1 hypothetical protein [Pyxidicoccus sp. MSG2]